MTVMVMPAAFIAPSVPEIAFAGNGDRESERGYAYARSIRRYNL